MRESFPGRRARLHTDSFDFALELGQVLSSPFEGHYNEHAIAGRGDRRQLSDQPGQWGEMIEKLLQASRDIERLAFGLLNPDAVFREVCETFQSKGDYDLAALQLIRKDEGIIETVFGTGVATDLVGRARHTLEDEQTLQDIQVAIALSTDPPRAEILAGDDDRFDDWIFENFKQIDWLRAFIPVLLVRDNRGNVLQGDPLAAWIADWKCTPLDQICGENSCKQVIEFRPPDTHETGLTWEIIGTIEVAYTNRHHRGQITSEHVIALTRLAADFAPKIYRVLLPSVLQAVADHACRVLPAESASLHFDFNTQSQRYVYEAGAGLVTPQFLARVPPRVQGLGRRAISARKPVFLPDPRGGHGPDVLQRTNPELYKLGIRSIAAIPLPVAGKDGVLYVGYNRLHTFTEQDIRSLEFFAGLAEDAVTHAMMFTQMRDRARLLENIHSVTESLVRTPKDNSLLFRIAWDSLNILAADVVTIYEYYQRPGRFKTPPVIAGRLLHIHTMGTEIDPEDAPSLLVEHAAPVFEANEPAKHKILNPARPRPEHKRATFPVRERIKSAAAIPLEVNDEIVGLMFINYRRHHPFLEDDQKLILTLASTAAIAIRNRRLLEELQATDNEMLRTPDLNHFLRRLVEHAVDITRATMAEIRLCTFPSSKLLRRARHGTSVRRHSAILESVAKRVCASRESIQDKYVSVTAAGEKEGISILSVPLLDRDLRVLGALTVVHDAENVFQRYEVLEQLAVKAVIAIQLADSQSKLIAGENIATVGHLAATSLHKVAGNIALLRKKASRLQNAEELSPSRRAEAEEICQIADVADNAVRRLEKWKHEKKTPVSLAVCLDEALATLDIPPRITVMKNMAEDLSPVFADQSLLVEILLNLLQNAVTAINAVTPASSHKLVVTAENAVEQGHHLVLLTIEDSGKGMSAVKRRKAGELGHKSSEGLGWGMWLSKTYIEKLGGSIEWKKRREGGTTVQIVIPAHTVDM